MAYSEKIAKTIEAYLKKEDWTFDYDSFHGTFSVEADLECEFGTALVVLQLGEDCFFSYTVLQDEARPAVRAQVGEYLHRANYGLPGGNFEFDYDSGEIHYKAYFDCPDEVPTERQMEAAFAGPLSVIDYYGNGLKKIMDSGDGVIRDMIAALDLEKYEG